MHSSSSPPVAEAEEAEAAEAAEEAVPRQKSRGNCLHSSRRLCSRVKTVTWACHREAGDDR